ncbi:MAG: tetratricopeptide repeat protein, partial [Prolixibacteraceae bacterium]|nr:tetratricopeptide repeat protein [Prolixibacteraceae bacterium]
MKKINLLFFFLFFAGTLPAQLNINHYITVGQTRIGIGNYVGAIEYFNIVIKFRPHLPEPYFYRGIAKHQLEDFRGAIQDYEKAIAIKPFYPDAYIHRGIAYHALGDYENAMRDYNKALEFDTNNEAIFNNRGIAKFTKKDIDGAIADYDKALEINPSSINALMNRSNAKLMKGDKAGAIKDLNSAIIIRPHYAGAYINRGLVRFDMQDYASALRDFDQAIRLEPENVSAFNNRGIVKQKLEDLHGAIMDYSMAISLDPANANAYFNRGVAREVLGLTGYDSDFQMAALLNPRYDLNRYVNERYSQQISDDNEEETEEEETPQQNQQTAQSQPSSYQDLVDDEQKKQDEEARKKAEEEAARIREEELTRRRNTLMLSDLRNLPAEDDEPFDEDDGRVQNRNLIIDLQPIFIISASEKNSINDENMHYYSGVIESLNRTNNYYPFLTITNKSNEKFRHLFENFILYFNDKIRVSTNSDNLLNRGVLLLLTDQYSRSIEDLNKAIQLNPRESLAFFTRGNCRFKMMQQIEAIPDFSEQLTVALASSKSQQPAELSLMQVIEDYDMILDDYNEVLIINPG